MKKLTLVALAVPMMLGAALNLPVAAQAQAPAAPAEVAAMRQ